MAKPARRSAAPRQRQEEAEVDAISAGPAPAADGAATPIEVLLGTMRALWQASRDGAGRVVDAKTAAAAAGLAKDAAPYVHPRLATIDAPPGQDLTSLSDAALDARIRSLLEQEESSCARIAWNCSPS